MSDTNGFSEVTIEAATKPYGDMTATYSVRFSAAEHVKALDGVRGIAILLVMVHHMTFIQAAGREYGLIADVGASGWIGVDVFFVLSSFLITGILLDSKGTDGYFSNFWIRRVLRIVPLYYAVLFISFAVLPHVPHPKLANFGRVAEDEWYYWLFLSNISIAKANGFRHGIVDVTWSLAIEEQFYLLWPFLIAFLSRRSLVITLALLFAGTVLLRIVLITNGVDPIPIYVLTPTHLDPIIVGAAVAILIRSPFPINGLQILVWFTMLITSALLIGLFATRGGLRSEDAVMLSVGFPIIAIFSGGLILSALINKATGAMLENRILRTFGFYSYAMYLFHLPIRAAIRDLLLPYTRWHDLPIGVLGGQMLFYAISITATFVAGWASYHLYEKHFLRLKRFFRTPPVHSQ
jgi:peptidoglycan/LPS O-acetylase OafA/YrhL